MIIIIIIIINQYNSERRRIAHLLEESIQFKFYFSKSRQIFGHDRTSPPKLAILY
jgi:hypothetical protein